MARPTVAGLPGHAAQQPGVPVRREAESGGRDSASNSWDLGLALTPADFDSVAARGWDARRKPDGSLPDVPMFHPRAGSAVVDQGVDDGLPYNVRAPAPGASNADKLSIPQTLLPSMNPTIRGPFAALMCAACAAPGHAAEAWKFAFGPGPAPAGYTPVAAATVYDAARGYGLEPDVRPDDGRPWYFSLALPEGTYRVAVTLGDERAAATTTVKSALRRLMLENVRTAPGEAVTRTFDAKVGTSQIAPAQGVAAGFAVPPSPRRTAQRPPGDDSHLEVAR